MFKETFKYYKRKQPSPDFSQVLDISDDILNQNIEVVNLQLTNLKASNLPGMIPPTEWKVFRIKTKNGLIFIRNPFTSIGQRYWISRCLKDYTKKPQKLNIDAHDYIAPNDDWWSVCSNQDVTKKESLLYKLRWATLGYHHNWDTKVYSESSRDIFPADLATLSGYVATALGFKTFYPEAAIVNFYHMDSTLSGHTDHSEDNLDAPLFSFSFGQSAIFLIGGLTEDEPGIPIFIHSGDIVIMSKESRLCYHAVPRITSSKTHPWNYNKENYKFFNNTFNLNTYEECKNEIFWKPFQNYIQKSRININVRQVLLEGQNILDR